MNNNIEVLNTLLLLYTIPAVIFLLAGIVVIVLGYGKEKKALKIAGLVIAVVGFKILLVLGGLFLYFKFLASITQANNAY